MFLTFRAAWAVVPVLALLGGCGNDTANDGQVRVVNATTEFATVDLYDVDSRNNSTLFIAGTASDTASGYQGLTEGTYQFNIVGAGGSSTAASITGAAITKGHHFTVVTYLTGSSAQATLLSDEEPSPNSGNAKLRIFNAADSEVGGVDVYVTSHACTALADTDTALTTDVTGLQSSFSQIIAASGGTTWNVCVTGTGNKADLRLSIDAATFADQQITTLILTRTAGGVLLNGMLLDQQGALKSYPNALARVRLVSDAAAGATVSATVNGVELAASQTSPTVNPYVVIPSGALTTTLAIGGTAVSAGSLSATAGADYTLLVAGSVAAPSLQLLADSNLPSTSSTLPVKIRLVNGVNALGGSASLNANGSLVGSAAAFGASSGYSNVASSAAAAELKVTSGATVVFDATSQTLTSGSVYTVFVLGDAAPGVPQGFVNTDR